MAHRCLQDLIKEVQLLAGALLPRRCHRVALVCSLAQRFSPSRLPSWSGATMASADSSAAIGCRRRHPTPVIRRAEEASHGKTLHFLGATAGFTRARDGRSIGRPRPWPGCPTALALYPISVRRPPDLPPASSPPRIAATQLPLAIGSAPCGPKRTFTSKFSAMRGTPWIPAFAGKAGAEVCALGSPNRRTPRHRPGRRRPTRRMPDQNGPTMQHCAPPFSSSRLVPARWTIYSDCCPPARIMRDKSTLTPIRSRLRCSADLIS